MKKRPKGGKCYRCYIMIRGRVKFVYLESSNIQMARVRIRNWYDTSKGYDVEEIDKDIYDKYKKEGQNIFIPMK